MAVVYYEDGVRFGTGMEMIDEIKRLRASQTTRHPRLCANARFALHEGLEALPENQKEFADALRLLLEWHDQAIPSSQ